MSNQTLAEQATRKLRIFTRVTVGVALVFPTLITWAYFVALKSSPAGAQQAAYVLGKVIQFAIPVCWIVMTRRTDMSLASVNRGNGLAVSTRSSGVWLGVGFGLFVGISMWWLYVFGLRSADFFDGPSEQVREKVSGMGLHSPAKYAAVGVFYAACHSLLEEYYWRWFVFRALRPMCPLPGAIFLSSVGFMAHHVLVLATYFGWTSPATWLFSVGVAIGGAAWAWLYDRSSSLLGPWASHCLVDTAIFWIGYDIVREVLQ